MTDTTLLTETGAASVAERPALPFGRLLAVEVRKLLDTRISKILLAILAALTVASITARGMVAGPDLELLVRTAAIGFGTLLPVLGILSVTSEWSQRTVLTTFALEPRRGRVLAAKCLPPLLLAVVASVTAIVVAVPVTATVAMVQGEPAAWDVAPLALLGWTATNVLVVAMGMALGMLLLNAPAAIVICLSTVVLWTGVGRLGSVGAFLTEWLALNTAAIPLAAADMTSGDLARLATAVTFWIVIPLTLGAVRVIRKEVR
ncbi:MAG: ABC transporter permease [Streptosporangiales bacterium]|nr:ABC transporter permease [Streptosporangiales bacterium]